MKAQNYKNHARYYPFHHFIITPLTLIYLGITVYRLDFTGEENTYASLYSLLGAIILVLLPLLARIYALKTQNRIILLEMRQRYFHLTGNSFYPIERQLRLGQIIALRFAGDEELANLIEQTILKKLSPKEIKLQIKDWQGDYRRV
ncbi:DUF6526 family protein [Algoriphagus boritolerans]|uniref:Uncharacterized protein n=1 Tax=Algoriphagus boritolerans DSM 17298 = JCM 18970 TaxID=1120964 RepID=A0A1H5TP47_9BACT|nr:DUF6526 family protein [Algoriphagus boritolerans]SEF63871.1 hypothetical protein SAMN03080598_00836 [Algoriphagus boritolerans DSM 17298 = JCM 18970]